MSGITYHVVDTVFVTLLTLHVNAQKATFKLSNEHKIMF